MHQGLLLKLNNVRIVPSFEYVGYKFYLKKKIQTPMFRSLRKAQKWSKVFIFW